MLKFLKNLEAEFSISKAAFIVGFFTLITKFLAIYRDRVFAAKFGQNAVLDSYFSAFRIPDFIAGLLILGTLSAAFLPFYAELRTKDNAKAEELANSVLTAALILITGICLIVLIFSEPLTRMVVPKFSPEQFSETLKLSRLFLLSPIIFGFGTIFATVLNGQKKFLVASFAPALYNLGIIFGAVFLYDRFGIIGLGYGVLLGALCQITIQFIAISLGGFRLSLRIKSVGGYFGKVIRLYLPRILSFDLSLVTLLVGSVIGSGLSEGSISALNQAYNLQSVPISVIALAFATAAFPALSEYFALKDEKKFLYALSETIKHSLFLMIPLSIFTLVFRAQVVRIILGTGKFSWEDTIATFTVLGIFAFSYFSQSLTAIMARAFYSRQNTKIPVGINLSTIVINIFLSFYFARFTHLGLSGLAIAYVISSALNALTLFFVFRYQLMRRVGLKVMTEFDSSLIFTVIRIVVASVLAGLVAHYTLHIIEPLFNTRTFVGLFLQTSISCTLGIVFYLALSLSLRIPQARRLLIPIFPSLLKNQENS